MSSHSRKYGILITFLALKSKRTPFGALLLTQAKYIRDLLHEVEMIGANSISTPVQANLKLTRHGSDYFWGSSYLQVCCWSSTICYKLTITSPEIGYAVNRVSQFMAQPLVTHWSAVTRIVRCLNGILDHGVTLQGASPASPLSLHTFCYADWTSDVDKRRSTSGAFVFFGLNLTHILVVKETCCPIKC